MSTFPKHRLPVLAAAMALALGLLAGCAGGTTGTAATVNGVDIPEKTITDYVQSLREAQGLTSNDEWESYLSESGQTDQSLRDRVVDIMVSREILRQGAKDLGISVSSAEVDEALAAKRKTYASDASWKEALADAGLTESTYRQELELDLLSRKVTQAFAENPTLGGDDTAGTEADTSGQDAEDIGADAALDWLANLRAEADITVNDAPSNLPY